MKPVKKARQVLGKSDREAYKCVICLVELITQLDRCWNTLCGRSQRVLSKAGLEDLCSVKLPQGIWCEVPGKKCKQKELNIFAKLFTVEPADVLDNIKSLSCEVATCYCEQLLS